MGEHKLPYVREGLELRKYMERCIRAADRYRGNVEIGAKLTLTCKACGRTAEYQAFAGAGPNHLRAWGLVLVRNNGRSECDCFGHFPDSFPYATVGGEAEGCPRPLHDFIKAGLAPRFDATVRPAGDATA